MRDFTSCFTRDTGSAKYCSTFKELLRLAFIYTGVASIPTWTFQDLFMDLFTPFANTQYLTISDQLKSGIRFFDFRYVCF